MTKQQQVALRNPCIVAEDCIRPIYRTIAPPWSVILTLNSGFE